MSEYRKNIGRSLAKVHSFQEQIGNLPASIWRFLADASSDASPEPGLNTTGPFEMDAGVVAAPGSNKFAYKESPVPRAGALGVEELDMIDVSEQFLCGAGDEFFGGLEIHSLMGEAKITWLQLNTTRNR